MTHLATKGAILLLLGSVVAGQMLRLPLLGQGGGLLVSDVATIIVLCTALLQGLKNTVLKTQNPNKTQSPKPKNTNSLEIVFWNLGTVWFFVLCLLCFFVLWGLFTLVIHWDDLGRENFFIAFLYWVRLTATLLLLPALVSLLRSCDIRQYTSQIFLLTITLLIVLGFLQLIFFPNLHQPGWDPHQGRLFSTWLDPNLFGGFLIITLPWVGSRLSASGERSATGRVRWHVGVLLLTALLALFLTQSRSSFIALAGAGILLFPLLLVQLGRFSSPARYGLALTLGISSLIIALAMAIFLPQRLAGLFTIDETAELRLVSLSSAWQLAAQHPWLGVGYNAYQFAARDEGLIQDFSLHSRAGTDNSFLTLAVTTGLPGLILFLLPWMLLFSLAVRRAIQADLAGLGAAAALLALFLHSQFVNSFLYSHLLITLIIITALTMTNFQTPMSNE